jgi:hypothetical protein
MGRKPKQFTANRLFLVGSGSSAIESKTRVAARHDDSRTASFRSEYSAAARVVVLQKICCLPSSKPEFSFVSLLKRLAAGHSDGPQKMIYGVRRGALRNET